MQPILEGAMVFGLAGQVTPSTITMRKRRKVLNDWAKQDRYFAVDLAPAIARGFYEGFPTRHWGRCMGLKLEDQEREVLGSSNGASICTDSFYEPSHMSVITYSGKYLRGFWVSSERLRFNGAQIRRLSNVKDTKKVY